MSKAIQPKIKSPWFLSSAGRRSLISILVLLHFSMIALSYSANWRRSAVQDKALGAMHPYLIGANFYQEMLPVEWVTESFKPDSLRIKVMYSDQPEHWKYVLRFEGQMQSAKADRLLHTLAELVAGGDSQGTTQLLKSIVQHVESENMGKDIFVSKIGIERSIGGTGEGGIIEGLYEASLARFPNGDFGFIPTIESKRSVQAVESAKVQL